MRNECVKHRGGDSGRASQRGRERKREREGGREGEQKKSKGIKEVEIMNEEKFYMCYIEGGGG